MPKLSWQIVSYCASAVLTLLITTLQEAGKLKGRGLVILISLAFIFTLMPAVGNGWVVHAPSRRAKKIRGGILSLLVMAVYVIFGAWLFSGSLSGPTEVLMGPQQPTTKPGDIQAPPEHELQENIPKLVSGKLDLDYKAVGLTYRGKTPTQKDTILFQHVIVANRSEKNMSLSFLLSIEVKDNYGNLEFITVNGAWIGLADPAGLEQNILNINKESSVEGQLIFELESAERLEIPKWNINFMDDQILLQIYDRITGVRIWCDPIRYPPAKSGRPFLTSLY